MKKFFLYFALTAFTAFTTTNAQAQDRKLVNMTGYNWYSNTWGQLPDGSWGYTPVKLDEPTLYDNYYYYYNSQNQLAIETTYTQLRYIYNDNGTKASKETWNFSNGIFCCTMAEIYEYDEEGNIILATTNYYNADGEITNSNPVEYSGYINGYYTIMKTPYYENHFEYVFNDDNQPTQVIQLSGDDFSNIDQGAFYTYENGVLVKEVVATYSANAEEGHEWDNITSTTEYTYNADGTINTRYVTTDANGSHNEIEWRYTYSTLDSSFVPQNVTADGTIGNNEVYVSWDAVPGAEKYIVMCDNTIAEVEGKTDYIVPTLKDGEHQIAVLAVVGGERKNISDFVKVSVKDEGNLPMENFKVNGASLIEEATDWGVNKYYALDLSWDIPEGASTITDYKVYIDNGQSWLTTSLYTTGLPADERQDNYNDISEWNTGTRIWWTNFENTTQDPETWETISLQSGPDCKIWICAVYVTGESQPSNVVEVNVYNLANGIEENPTGIDNSTPLDNNSNQAIEFFNLNGQQVSNSHGKNVVIMRQGNQVRKIIK
jgi:hypothetical protein